MDTNHPIPQDVTGFQFRLIGSMTVKQFGYVAVGAVAAVIMYYAPIFILLKVILIPLFAGAGFAFAFIPLEGRPLDDMVGYFIKALTQPNQYVFHKTMGHFSFDLPSASLPVHLPVAVQKAKKGQTKATTAAKQQQLNQYLQQLGHQTVTPNDEKEQSFVAGILSQANGAPPPMQKPVDAPVPQEPPAPEPEPLQEPTPSNAPYLKPLDLNVETPAPVAAPVIIQTPPVAPPQPVTITTPAFVPTPLAQPVADVPLQPQSSVDEEMKVALDKEQKELEEKEKKLRQEEAAAQKAKEEEERMLEEKEAAIAKAEEESKKIASDNQQTHSKLVELEQSLQDMASQKQSLEQELERLKNQLKTPTAVTAFTPAKPVAEPKPTTQLARQVAQDQAVKKGLPPTPDVPNILLGVVKDSSGNIIPNVLIEVKDPEGNPVRAFKTNQLGQFASATQLLNGIYTIEFEDPQGKNKFDTIEIEAKGEILLPIEVISHDLREELRKQLFS